MFIYLLVLFLFMVIPTKPFPYEGYILVIGATGTVGREVVEQLLAAGERVKVAVRSPSKVMALKGRGVEVAELDFARTSTLENAFKGVDRLFLLTPFDSRMVQFTEQLVREAQHVGVKHIVKLSAGGADVKSPLAVGRWHGEAEKLVAESGIPFTILRPNMFMQNFLTFFADSIRSEGKFYVPAGEGKIAFIDARDIARLAVLALTKNGYDDKVYNLTGAEALSFYDAAKILSKKLGRVVEYVAVSPEDARESMSATRMPLWMIDAMLELYGAVRAGHLSVVFKDYTEVTGKKPILFSEFVLNHNNDFV